MINWLKHFLITEDDNDPKFVNLLRNILIVILIVLVLVAIVQSGILIGTFKLDIFAVVISMAVLTGLFLYLTNKNMLWPGKLFLPSIMLISITYLVSTANGLHDVAVSGFPVIIMVASLLLGRRTLPFWAIFTSACIGFVGYWDIAGFTPEPIARTTGIDTIAIGILMIIASAGISNILLRRFEEIIIASRKSEASQLEANKELKQLQESLEQQVQERTAELASRGFELEKAVTHIQRRAAQFEALAQVAQSISSIRDPQELLPLITSVVSEYFGFYHVGIFLIDEFNEYAVFTAANSEGGKRMLERKHRLRVGEEGIVGNVTATGEPRIALDVGNDAVYFGNPDLPDTHSEMALPLKSSGKIVGALDVQSTERGAFTNDDVQTLSLLADQVSLAIENARLFESSNRTLNELQIVMRQSTREAWKRLPEKQNLLGFRYNSMGASPLKESIDLTETGKGKAKAKGTMATSFVVPIELRGEVIGNLVVQSPSGGTWNEDQQDLIRAVAERVALSAENARLFDETTLRAERERLVSEITSKIRSHNDPQSMIETAISELRTALGASRVEIVPQKTQSAVGKDSKV
jgi:GAF domain-containing protein